MIETNSFKTILSAEGWAHHLSIWKIIWCQPGTIIQR